MIEHVYFDAGGTLIEPYPSVGEVYARAGRPHGLLATPDDLESAFRRTWTQYVEHEGDAPLRLGRDDQKTRAWWRRLVDQVLDEVSFTNDRDAIFDAFFDAFASPNAWRVFDDVSETLKALDVRGVRMGILSNWDYRLHRLLEVLDLGSRFDPVIVSADVGLAKPDPAFYRLALERVGLPPDRVLHVGDHMHLDFDPARAMGMAALLIDRTQRQPGPRSIARLVDLVTFLDPR